MPKPKRKPPFDHDAWASTVASLIVDAAARHSKPKVDAIIDELVAQKVADRMKASARRGGAARHSEAAELKREALDLYNKGSWPSKAKAAEEIFNKLEKSKYSKALTKSNGQQTVYRWLLKA